MPITTARDLAAAVKGRRLDLGWSQAAAAREANVSRKWLVEFERGKSTVDLALVLRVLDALGLNLQTVASGTPKTAPHAESAGADVHVDLDDLLAGYLEQ